MGEGTDNRTDAQAPDDGFARLWRRVGEHRVAQWAIAYVGLAYGIQHAVILTSESFEWPNIVARVSMLVLILGLPLAMTFAWYHGAKLSRRVSGAELTIISLLLVGLSILFFVFVRPEAGVTPTVQEASLTAARRAAADPRGTISVAVMPFTNLSGDKDQEYFSDGMTDEISGALVRIPDLRVVARTSAFQFKGKNGDARSIGSALGATHLIEGSVRKAGNRVRITAELVKADNGVTVWSNNYDRELTDVFAIQEDIARAIATSFGMQVGLKPGARLVADQLADQDTHELYLRGRSLLRARGGLNRQGLAVLEQVVARAPNFAPGWALLSQILRTGGGGSADATIIKRAEDAARRAIELDPDLADGYSALAAIQSTKGEWAETLELNKKALALDPDNPEVLHNYRTSLQRLGYIKEALRVSEHLTTVEPLVYIYSRITGEIEMANGQRAGTRTLAKAMDQYSATSGGTTFVRNFAFLAAAQAQEGRLAEAIDTLMKGEPEKDGEFDARHVEAAVQALRAAATKQKPPPLPAFNSELNFVYIYAGVPERMLEWQEQGPAYEFAISRNWWPLPASVRKTERFKAVLRKAGLVDYWRKNGWPDLCHPTTGDDFACE